MRRSLSLYAITCLLLAGCSSGKTAALTVDHADTLVDQPVHLRVIGAPAGKAVQVEAAAVDADGKTWHSQATFTADTDGTVDLDGAKPSGGSYQDADGMGLFWSMDPPDGDPDNALYVPPVDHGQRRQHVDVFVSSHGKRIVSTSITRHWLSPGTTTRSAPPGLTGTYVVPKPDGRRHPAVLLLGGSEGGLPPQEDAALLASHGYPVLMLAYFNAPGRPAELRNIPIEYFAAAATWLAEQRDVDPAAVVVMGTSYGTEAALLLADHYPALIHGTILFAPSATSTSSAPRRDGSAWTYQGKPLPIDVPIPVGGVNGPLLAVAGGADLVWESRLAAQFIIRELDAAHHKDPHQAVVVDGAGHGVGGIPYLPRGTKLTDPAAGTLIDLGGTRAANESALKQGWTKTLALLASLKH
ncbi:MAG TPA: acyl-CoA thioesterase/bile acid-CoA:amino acid N-acyltransferase family protein [Kribbella sp.]|nr:acyl-CoA thioesterase/bile acid-CoA:amino acid N-acyltransferase family protein [Kribbella sp.]